MTFDRERMKNVASQLAAKDVFIGTSSWKYPGWRGQLYNEEKYTTRGKFSESRFNRDCLADADVGFCIREEFFAETVGEVPQSNAPSRRPTPGS